MSNKKIYLTEINVPRPPYIGDGSWHIQSINNMTILFGKNGSGKSNLLRSIANQNPGVCHYMFPERTGEIVSDLGIVQSQIHKTNNQNSAASPSKNLSPNYRQEAVSRIHVLLLKMSSVPGGTPLSSAKEDIEELLSFLLPDFYIKIVAGEPNNLVLKRITNDKPVSTVEALSSGEAEILGLGLDLLSACAIWDIEKQEKRILLIDEPDAHLHQDLQQQLAFFLIKVSEKYNAQMIISTHSTTLLSALGFYGSENTSVVYLDKNKSNHKAEKFNYVLQKISMCLGGHLLMGPLFGAPLWLVEGDDDYKIWSHVPRVGSTNLAVIPCHGESEVKKYQKMLEKIFHVLRSDEKAPVGFALLDGDQSKPQESPDSQQKNIKFLTLECRESENLFFTEEVLNKLGFTWEQAQIKIKVESHRYIANKELLDQCDKWDRKEDDLKGVIKDVSEILDQKQVPWTLRIAQVIGFSKPTGELADYLGVDILSALWK